MILGTIDIQDLIVDYTYYYTPGDLDHPPMEKVLLTNIYRVDEYKEGSWQSKLIKKKSLTPSVIAMIERKCRLDGNKLAITYNEIHS